jgi:endonuclease/exonuclease/phosphatase family metal-dependent hydrolase
MAPIGRRKVHARTWRRALGACGRRAVAVASACALVPAPAGAQGTLRVVAYNIRHGQGMDDRVDLRRVAETLRALGADVITLQEVDDRTERTGGVDQTAVLADLLTRLPVVSQTTHRIPPASESGLSVHEVVVEAAPGRRVSVVSVHLAGTAAERMAQADTVTVRFADRAHPVILAGDFNGRPDDEVVGRLRGAWRVAVKRGDPRTYPADRPSREIDFVMWRPGAEGSEAGLRLLRNFVGEERLASDHRPVVADFRLEPERRDP